MLMGTHQLHSTEGAAQDSRCEAAVLRCCTQGRPAMAVGAGAGVGSLVWERVAVALRGRAGDWLGAKSPFTWEPDRTELDRGSSRH
jgi:hypothetical protein